MERKVTVKKIYRHFKDKLYFVEDIATNTETEEVMVVYRALYGEYKLFVRPINMFLQKVPKEKENPTGQEYRFMEVE
ncbi:DUF1653 domain-containing protein [Clostridium senegalense]